MSTSRDATQNARTVTKGNSRERKKKKKEDEVRVNVAYYIMKAFDILLWTDIYRPPDASN